MSWNSGKLSWSEVRDLFRKWREENERNSREIVDLWETVLMKKVHKLGDERLLVLEQVCVAALDCNRLDVADRCVHTLSTEFPTSLRVRRLRVLQLEAMERYDEALELLDSIIKRDETNAAPRKRRVAIFKARGKIPEAIKELTDYLKKFMSDQEGWQELCELYLMEQDLARAAFCMEELLLHNPHSHLIHQRYAEIKYTQAATNIGLSPKCTSTKKKEAQKLAKWALHEIALRYERQSRNKKQVASLESLVSSLQISGTS
ncbi:ER membrane protein complex subunit 2-like isoform X2 [Schistocerca piceifrons]|uniref:ER membrane protein complex subunit 2-like isoform X2 n=1 Tax=Schistocerca piceifrons TaxID=274613 RepID=UPI001F5F1C5D|nr:ER membrane protein complex subunit 2-like isoform X2 [Schistocerca piceifrons]